jgi:hypothetical protein
MKIRTFDKETTIHVINLLSLPVAWGVSGYLIGETPSNGNIGIIAMILALPVQLFDYLAGLLSVAPASGNFNALLFILWISYALIGRCFSPLLMVRNHSIDDLQEWYLSRKAAWQ